MKQLQEKKKSLVIGISHLWLLWNELEILFVSKAFKDKSEGGKDKEEESQG